MHSHRFSKSFLLSLLKQDVFVFLINVRVNELNVSLIFTERDLSGDETSFLLFFIAFIRVI